LTDSHSVPKANRGGATVAAILSEAATGRAQLSNPGSVFWV
jgi:hypothetical protein